MKVQIPGTPQLLGNTPEEIMEGLIELGFMDPPATSVEAYVEHLAEQLNTRFDVQVAGGGDVIGRAEEIINALAELGELDVLED